MTRCRDTFPGSLCKLFSIVRSTPSASWAAFDGDVTASFTLGLDTEAPTAQFESRAWPIGLTGNNDPVAVPSLGSLFDSNYVSRSPFSETSPFIRPFQPLSKNSTNSPGESPGEIPGKTRYRRHCYLQAKGKRNAPFLSFKPTLTARLHCHDFYFRSHVRSFGQRTCFARTNSE